MVSGKFDNVYIQGLEEEEELFKRQRRMEAGIVIGRLGIKENINFYI